MSRIYALTDLPAHVDDREFRVWLGGQIYDVAEYLATASEKDRNSLIGAAVRNNTTEAARLLDGHEVPREDQGDIDRTDLSRNRIHVVQQAQEDYTGAIIIIIAFAFVLYLLSNGSSSK